jgi:vacuolar-type H+-ATPase subunit C/Vma6
MKSTLTIEADDSDKLNLLMRVAQEMGLRATTTSSEDDSKTLTRPGAPLSAEALEKLAANMEADDDVLDEKESKRYLQELKEVWKKVTP